MILASLRPAQNAAEVSDQPRVRRFHVVGPPYGTGSENSNKPPKGDPYPFFHALLGEHARTNSRATFYFFGPADLGIVDKHIELYTASTAKGGGGGKRKRDTMWPMGEGRQHVLGER